MDKEDILYLCGIGDFVQVDFEGESVTGQVERVSAAVLFIVRSDDRRRQGISLDKIASISPLPSGTPVKSAKGKASDAVAQPSGPDQTACLAQAARLIVLPQPVLQGHREDVKAALKNTRQISIAWSGLDSVFQDARRSNALELKRPQIMQRMSALLAEYPEVRPVYVYAAEIQAAFGAWESAWGLYCQGGDYQNALYAAQQAENPAAILQVLQCAMKENSQELLLWQGFFYYMAKYRAAGLAARLLAEMVPKSAELQELAGIGCWSLLAAWQAEGSLSWNGEPATAELLKQAAVVLERKKAADEPAPANLPALPVKQQEEAGKASAADEAMVHKGQITYLYNANRMYGYINKNVYFYLRQVEDDRLRRFLYENGFVRELAVEFQLGRGIKGPAADHIRLAPGENIAEGAAGTAWIESYDYFGRWGRIEDAAGGRYSFRIDEAVRDPFLREYLLNLVVEPSAFGQDQFVVEFTLKNLGAKQVVKQLAFSQEARNRMCKVYGERIPANLLKMDDAAWNLRYVPQAVPDYEPLPPLEKEVRPARAEKAAEKDAPAEQWAAAQQNAQPKEEAVPVRPLSTREYTYTNMKHPCKTGIDYLTRVKDLDEAEHCFLAALEAKDQPDTALAGLVGIYLRRENEAEKGLAILTQHQHYLEPEKALNLKIQLLDKIGNHRDLAETLKRALPSTFKVSRRLHYIFTLARIHLDDEQYAEAIHWYEEWLKVRKANCGYQYSNTAKLAPMEFNVYRGLAICCYENGDVTRAEAYARKLLQLQSADMVAKDILSGTFQIRDFFNGRESTAELSADWLLTDHGNMTLYAQNVIDGVELATVARGRKISPRIINEVYQGNPAQANADIRYYRENIVRFATPEAKSVAWAFLAKIVEQVRAVYKDEEECARYQLTVESLHGYAGRSMMAAGDAELLKLQGSSSTARFFYREAMLLLQERQIHDYNLMLRFMATFFLAQDELRRLLDKMTNSPLQLEYIKTRECFAERELLLATFTLPRSVEKKTKQFIEGLGQVPHWKEQAMKLFAELGGSPDNDFYACWEKAKAAYLQQQQQFRESLQHIGRETNRHEHFSFLMSRIEKVLEQKLLSAADQNTVAGYLEVLRRLEQAQIKDAFEQKEEDYNRVIHQAAQLAEMIGRQPTSLGYDVVREELFMIRGMAEESLDVLYRSSPPQLTLDIQTMTAVQEPSAAVGTRVKFMIFIKNEENHDAADSLELEAVGIRNDIRLQSLSAPILSVRGGRRCEQLYEAVLTEQEVQQKFFELQVRVKYEYKDSHEARSIKTLEQQFNIPLQTSADFEAIPNPYAPIDSRNGIPEDSRMFYGRNGDIAKIVQMLQAADGSMLANFGIYMYGQKRAGKTSIMGRLKDHIQKAYPGAYIVVDLRSVGDIVDIQNTGEANRSFINFLFTIMDRFAKTVRREFPTLAAYLREQQIQFPCQELLEAGSNAQVIFNAAMREILQAIQDFGGMNQYIPLFFMDEFTYFYEGMKRGVISTDFMKFWKSFLSNYHVCTIIIGMDNMPNFVAEYPNEFACMQAYPVSFLAAADMKQLADEPIRMADGSSHFKDEAGQDALDYIYMLTAGSAYLTVMFCNQMVDYLNETRTTYITRTVLDIFIKERLFASLSVKKPFDPQINDPSKFAAEEQRNTCEDNMRVMTCIALQADDIHHEAEISQLDCVQMLSKPTREYQQQVLDQLVFRGVLELREKRYYRIRIDLLRKWLLREIGREY